MPFHAIINNISLLLALSMAYALVVRNWHQDQTRVKITTGILFGLVAIAGMINSFTLSPGIIFDGRSVIISVAGLFLGPLTAAIAASLASCYRIWIGGAGALSGVLTLVISCIIGTAGFYLCKKKKIAPTLPYLIFFGLFVHIFLFVIFYLALPAPYNVTFFKQLGIPFLTLLPIGTVLLGKLIDGQNARIRNERELAKKHALLRCLIDSIPDLIFYKDPKSVYLGCNEAFTEFTDRERPEEIIGLTDFDFFPKDLADFFREKDQQMLAEEKPRRDEEWVDYPDGRHVLLDTLKTPYYDHEDNMLGLIGISRDITELKESEKAVRQSERLLKDVFESIQDGISVLDTELNIISVNKKMEEMYSDMAPLQGKKCYKAYHGRKKPCTICPTIRALNSKKLEQDEVPYFHQGEKKGVLELFAFPMLDDNNNPTGIVEYVRDITERHKHEEQKKAEYARFKSVLDSFDSLVYVADMETYELLFINKYGRKLFGDVTGKICWQTLQDGQSGPCKFCTNEKLLDPDGKSAGVYIWEFQNTVTIDWFECRDQAIPWDDGRYVRLEIATNINQQKKAAQEREKLQRQLRQAQKMEAIGTLAGGIAHDFNNILVPILAYSEMLLESLPDSDQETKHDLAEVLKAAKRAKDLVKQILTFSRQTEHELEPLLITPIIKESLKLLKASLPSNIETRFQFNADRSTIFGDPTHVQQIVMNLCTNSYHAMRDKGGILEVALDEVEIDREDFLQHKNLVPGSYIKLSINDTGHGMEKQVLEKIFDPYFTTKKQGEGTGIGLSVVHGIVKNYGGDITVYSEVGHGTSFHVYIPAITATQDIDKMPLQNLPLPGGNEHILLVDDEEPIIGSTSLILESLGYKVTARTSSVAALEVFKNKCDDFDLVITDQTMPKMTGDVLSKEIMQIRPDIPIILCTGFSSTIDESKAKKIGIKKFLMKPLIRKDLASTIRIALEKK